MRAVHVRDDVRTAVAALEDGEVLVVHVVVAVGVGLSTGDAAVVRVGGQTFLYVTDMRAHRVEKFVYDELAGLVKHVDGWGSLGTGDGEFVYPHSIAVDTVQNRLFVTDAGNGRLQVSSRDGIPRSDSIWGQWGKVLPECEPAFTDPICPANPVFDRDADNDVDDEDNLAWIECWANVNCDEQAGHVWCDLAECDTDPNCPDPACNPSTCDCDCAWADYDGDCDVDADDYIALTYYRTGESGCDDCGDLEPPPLARSEGVWSLQRIGGVTVRCHTPVLVDYRFPQGDVGSVLDITWQGDFDGDGDVDQYDLEHLDDPTNGCYSGQNNPLTPGMGCEHADYDRDGDVDEMDFAKYLRNVTGDLECSDTAPEPDEREATFVLGEAAQFLLHQQGIDVWANGQITVDELYPLAEVYADSRGIPFDRP